MADSITVSTEVPVSKAQAWHHFTDPDSITRWNFASPDWHCPSASIDLRVGGRHLARMETRDGSMGFDYGGSYAEVTPPDALALVLDDGRHVHTVFEETAAGTRITTIFDADKGAPADLQRQGWQAILDNYKAFVCAAGA